MTVLLTETDSNRVVQIVLAERGDVDLTLATLLDAAVTIAVLDVVPQSDYWRCRVPNYPSTLA